MSVTCRGNVDALWACSRRFTWSNQSYERRGRKRRRRSKEIPKCYSTANDVVSFTQQSQQLQQHDWFGASVSDTADKALCVLCVWYVSYAPSTLNIIAQKNRNSLSGSNSKLWTVEFAIWSKKHHIARFSFRLFFYLLYVIVCILFGSD